MSQRELQGAIERAESARTRLVTIARTTIDRGVRLNINEVIERDLNELISKLEYVRDVSS